MPDAQRDRSRDLPIGILRYLWPQHVVCRACGHPHTAQKTNMRRARRTVRCPKCQHTWAMIATHAEVDQGGGVGQIQAL